MALARRRGDKLRDREVEISNQISLPSMTVEKMIDFTLISCIKHIDHLHKGNTGNFKLHVCLEGTFYSVDGTKLIVRSTMQELRHSFLSMYKRNVWLFLKSKSQVSTFKTTDLGVLGRISQIWAKVFGLMEHFPPNLTSISFITL